MSGAEPCTGSYNPTQTPDGLRPPSDAEGSMPIDPASMRRRGQHADRSGQHGALVAEDVAEHVLRQYDVETARIQDQLHRAVIDQQVIQRHIRILGGDLCDYLPP